MVCKYLNMVPLSHFQYKVRTLQDLVSLKDSDRRNMLRFLGEEKYDEVMAVLGSFPYINMETKLQGGFKQRLYTHTFNKKTNITCDLNALTLFYHPQCWMMKIAITSQQDPLSQLQLP